MGEKSFEQVQTRRKTHVAGRGVGMMDRPRAEGRKLRDLRAWLAAQHGWE
jgi:hypothetical protein